MQKVILNAPKFESQATVWRGTDEQFWGGSLNPPKEFIVNQFASFTFNKQTAAIFTRIYNDDDEDDEPYGVLLKIRLSKSISHIFMMLFNQAKEKYCFQQEQNILY